MKLLYVLLLLPALAFGGGNTCERNPHYCGEQGEQGDRGRTGSQGEQGERGARGRTGPQGEQGETGAQGERGETGAQGERGLTGAQGEQGERGLTGAAGVVSTKWIDETRTWQNNWYNYSAANEAIQIHLPQEQKSRVTFGMSRVHGTSGYGLGYAYMNEEGVAFTVGLGKSGGESVGKASVGFEFGGTDDTSYSSKYAPVCSYVTGELRQEGSCIK